VISAEHHLDRKAHVDKVAVRCHVHTLEVVDERRPLVLRHTVRSSHDVVSVKRRHGHELHIDDPQTCAVTVNSSRIRS
jgi:hypothetical protein